VVSHNYDKPIPRQNRRPEVSVQIIVPARNEEAGIGRCLESLVSQQGIGFEITVVDDGSTDRTREIAGSFEGVRVLRAPEPPPGVSGKCNALMLGSSGATARWLLFTDADTLHYPNSLAHAVNEAETSGVDLLSYSPEQETISWSERALMPLVFAELVRVYPPQRVNDPQDPTVAANGQYILVRRDAYEALGGHRAVADKILEDIELARLLKASYRRILFRHGVGLVRARMYRDFRSMCEGWTKNLALLFPHPLALAVFRIAEFVTLGALAVVATLALTRGRLVIAFSVLLAAAALYAIFWRRVERAHFPAAANLTCFFGLPLFAWLLVRSWLHFKVRDAVTWKGRTYSHSAPDQRVASSIGRDSEAES
jgi:glycosyltransferase involved in cell wall biosynthesis